MSVASGFPDTEQLTRLSQNPKDEVACGLVLRDKRLQGLDRREIDHVITGEDCKIVEENQCMIASNWWALPTLLRQFPSLLRLWFISRGNVQFFQLFSIYTRRCIC